MTNDTSTTSTDFIALSRRLVHESSWAAAYRAGRQVDGGGDPAPRRNSTGAVLPLRPR